MAIGEGASSSNQALHDHVARGTKVGFFTDPTLCIGCKACEVACKEWNRVPDDGYRFSGESYDNSGGLSASTWRHVKFVELGGQERQNGAEDPVRWLFLSDVCKHCEVAGCLEACPTGAILRNEVGAVFVQDDVCNGCGYCVVSCPFGVVDRRPKDLPGGGGAFKCTLCYDRQISGLTPACAKACPTESISFGPLAALEHKARARVAQLQARGYSEARIYDAHNSSVGKIHAMFLTPIAPERFGLPPAPEAPTSYLSIAWTAALVSGVFAFLFTLAAFVFAG